MTSVQEIILLFTKYPQPGKSKTRMIPNLGEKGAADLQRKMTEMIAAKALAYTKEHSCRLEIFFHGGTSTLMRQWLGSSYSFRRQPEGELGAKMAAAICQYLVRYRSILLIGADCPGIDSAVFRSGFSALQANDIVLGPAFDGGYYLIGIQGSLRQSQLHALFSGVSWGTGRVLDQTLNNVKKLDLNYHLLKKLHDIDTFEDLRYLHNHPCSQ